MPYRMFCDNCDKETVRNYVGDRAIVSFQGWKAEVMIAKNGVYNGGIICRECLDLILKEGTYGGRFLQAKEA